MKTPSVVCCLLALGSISHSSGVFAQSAAFPGNYRACIESSADARKSLVAPGMPEVSKRLMQITLDDQICDCIKEQEPKATTSNSADPMLGYLAVHATCLARHVNKEFPEKCPSLYGVVLSEAGQTQVPSATIGKICACATDKMKAELTSEAQQQSDLEQYRYYNVLVEDKKNGTSKAKQLRRPGPSALERGMLGLQTCLKETLVDPQSSGK